MSPAPTKKAAVFLDRDGVLNVDLGYTYKITDLKLVSGVVSGLRKLHAAGYVFVVVTNQSGIARGLFDFEHVHQFNLELTRRIQTEAPEITFLEFMICPHVVGGSVAEYAIACTCRKPGTKLITDAADKYQIDLTKSWMIGDKDSDVQCALNAGMRGIQVTRGGKQYDHHKQAFAKVETLDQAADVILLNR